jgi:hypothetical protein
MEDEPAMSAAVEQRNSALGSEVRSVAEDRVRKLQAEIEGLEAQVERLQSPGWVGYKPDTTPSMNGGARTHMSAAFGRRRRPASWTWSSFSNETRGGCTGNGSEDPAHG